MGKGHTKIVVEIRKRLREYGVSKDESILAALDRLLAEHQEACQDASKALADTSRMVEKAALACKTRDEAQESSNKSLARERAAVFENLALRDVLSLIVTDLAKGHIALYAHRLADIDTRKQRILAEAQTTSLETELRDPKAVEIADAEAHPPKRGCGCCGRLWTMYEAGSWRWNGARWEHRCPGLFPQTGHVDATVGTKEQLDVVREAREKGADRNSPLGGQPGDSMFGNLRVSRPCGDRLIGPPPEPMPEMKPLPDPGARKAGT